MSDQQKAREALRSIWWKLVDEQLPSALAAAHADHAAQKVLQVLVSHPFDPAKYEQLDTSSGDLLDHSCPFDACKETIAAALVRAAEEQLPQLVIGNRHASGAKLRALVEQELSAQDDGVRRHYDELCARRGSDRFANVRDTKARVLIGLADATRTGALAHARTGGDETELKRRAKALAVLLDDRFTTAQRASALQRLAESASTASFPYILRYLFPDALPQAPPLPSADGGCVDGFSNDLLACCDEARLIRDAVLRFENNESLFGEFADVEAPLAAELEERFRAYPHFLPSPSSKILLPKQDALTAHRGHRYRLPDGIVAALGLCLVLEWTMRQAVFVANLGAHERPRAAALIKRLHEGGMISDATRKLLVPLFDWSALSVRDGLVHGAFHGNDPLAVRRVVLAASHALKSLAEELARSVPTVFSTPRWDAASPLSTAHVAFARSQLTVGAVLFDQISDDDRSHLFQVLARLSPDKRLLGQASFLFFVHAYKELAKRKEMARDELFSACVGLHVTLEDLFRAVLEERGYAVLRVSPQPGDAAKCEMAILDGAPGNLLSPAAFTKVFGNNSAASLSDAFATARAFRDSLFHGRLSELSAHAFSFTHLAAKLLFALSASA